MKVINFIFEILTAPLALVLRTSESRKNSLSSFAKPFVVFLISIFVVALLVLYFYQDFIFHK